MTFRIYFTVSHIWNLWENPLFDWLAMEFLVNASELLCRPAMYLSNCGVEMDQCRATSLLNVIWGGGGGLMIYSHSPCIWVRCHPTNFRTACRRIRARHIPHYVEFAFRSSRHVAVLDEMKFSCSLNILVPCSWQISRQRHFRLF